MTAASNSDARKREVAPKPLELDVPVYDYVEEGAEVFDLQDTHSDYAERRALGGVADALRRLPARALARMDEAERERDEALAEVERLTASMEEVVRRLTDTEWSSHPDDRIRVALLHAEAALEGKSRPLAMVKDTAHAAGYAEGVARVKAVIEAECLTIEKTVSALTPRDEDNPKYDYARGIMSGLRSTVPQLRNALAAVEDGGLR